MVFVRGIMSDCYQRNTIRILFAECHPDSHIAQLKAVFIEDLVTDSRIGMQIRPARRRVKIPLIAGQLQNADLARIVTLHRTRNSRISGLRIIQAEISVAFDSKRIEAGIHMIAGSRVVALPFSHQPFGDSTAAAGQRE